MSARRHIGWNPPALALAFLAISALCLAPGSARADAELQKLLRCQKTIARAGARYAFTVVTRTLKCTNAVVACQVDCDNGVFGPSCATNPPPCCDSDDPSSNQQFQSCMDDANATCAQEQSRIDLAEARKRKKIENACETLSIDQLCGTADTPGLNFDTLVAGCEALIPGWTCGLQGILDCVGGPLQQALGEEIGGLLDPRASQALPAAGVSGFSGIARTVKLKESLGPGKMDVWSIQGQADEKIRVAVDTLDEGGGVSGLEPRITYVGTDGSTPVQSTAVVSFSCSTPNSCGQPCPAFKRRFPFDGTFFLVVEAAQDNGCGGGAYRLIVTTDDGTVPTLVVDDDPDTTP